MAQFCTCGSLMINDNCTNKNCASKPANASSLKKSTQSKTKQPKEPKATRTRKSSKCITYNLYDKKEEESSL